MKKAIIASLIFLPSMFLVGCAGVVDSPGYDVDYVYSGGDVYPDYWDNMGYDAGFDYVGIGGYYGGGGWHGGGGGWHGGGGGWHGGGGGWHGGGGGWHGGGGHGR